MSPGLVLKLKMKVSKCMCCFLKIGAIQTSIACVSYVNWYDWLLTIGDLGPAVSPCLHSSSQALNGCLLQ